MERDAELPEEQKQAKVGYVFPAILLAPDLISPMLSCYQLIY